MKTKILLSALATVLIFGGCARDKDIAPQSSPDAAFACTHVDFGANCDYSKTVPLAASDGSLNFTPDPSYYPPATYLYGTAAFFAHNTHVRIALAKNSLTKVGQVSVFMGDAADIPLNADGTVNNAAFPHQFDYINEPCPINIPVPYTEAGCKDIVVAITLYVLDGNGDLNFLNVVWAKETRVGSNGWYTEYCFDPCPNLSVTPSCTDLFNIPGYPSESCVTLNAIPSDPGLGVTWGSTGVTTSSITVCPANTTSYFVYLTAWGIEATATVRVHNVTYCGSNKIIVCHDPPGAASGHQQCKSLSWLHNYLDNNGGVSALNGSGTYTLGPCSSEIFCE